MTSRRNEKGSKVFFQAYAVCQDYPLDEGRLYRTSGGGMGWVSLGQGIWVYPDPERLSVCIKGVNRRAIELSERELDAMDAVQFSAKLREAGYDAPQGSSWYILDYVRSAVDSGTAVTPLGLRSASTWPASIFRHGGALPGWRGGVSANPATQALAR